MAASVANLGNKGRGRVRVRVRLFMSVGKMGGVEINIGP